MAHVPPRQGAHVFGIGPGRFVLVQHPTRDESDEYYLCAHINNGFDWMALTTQEEEPYAFEWKIIELRPDTPWAAGSYRLVDGEDEGRMAPRPVQGQVNWICDPETMPPWSPTIQQTAEIIAMGHGMAQQYARHLAGPGAAAGEPPGFTPVRLRGAPWSQLGGLPIVTPPIVINGQFLPTEGGGPAHVRNPHARRAFAGRTRGGCGPRLRLRGPAGSRWWDGRRDAGGDGRTAARGRRDEGGLGDSPRAGAPQEEEEEEEEEEGQRRRAGEEGAQAGEGQEDQEEEEEEEAWLGQRHRLLGLDEYELLELGRGPLLNLQSSRQEGHHHQRHGPAREHHALQAQVGPHEFPLQAPRGPRRSLPVANSPACGRRDADHLGSARTSGRESLGENLYAGVKDVRDHKEIGFLAKIMLEMGNDRISVAADMAAMRIREIMLAKKDGGSWDKASAVGLQPGPQGGHAAIPDGAFVA